ncbi:LPP20 family lipoprotein [Helicobacter heilmannii]|uniref:LPP20 family lipoprotein n=1 Tax=Helicobacter heilmannii TaxID=35817 RepID=UPI0006A1A850|nr:LPP20 family lipoprotein [Helicobacter heilmannii]GMB93960.1 LPP20 lipoprotein [Helicobacter heilmannii]CRF49151.1 conserved lipoprotein [Helicobacter heilmannii]
MRAKQWLLLGSVVGALIIVGCGEPKSGVSKENKEYHKETKGAPKWVVGDLNEIKMHNKEYTSVFLGRGEYDIVGGDVAFATDQAAAAAKANLAANLKTELIKEVQSHKASDGHSMDNTSSVDVGEKVDKVLNATKLLARWVGKDKVWVLYGLDKDIVSKVRRDIGLQ